MKNLLLLIVLLFPFKIFAQDCEKPKMREPVIRGFVFDSKSSKRFPAVLITLFDCSNVIKAVLSDLEGRYVMQIPKSKGLSDSLRLEFIFYGYKPTILIGNVFNVKELNIEMHIDPDKNISKEKYLKVYKERCSYTE